jgi:putative aldouronate transport system substrate-binding protein
METKLSRREFLTASAAVAAGVALSACGATPTSTPVPPTATKPAAAPPPATAVPQAATAVPATATKPAATATLAPTAVPTRVTVELVITRYEHPSQPIFPDAPAHLATTQATGVKMNFQPVPLADYLAKQKIWMATKQVPDIMRTDLNDIRDFANPAVFQPVLPLIDKYAPNLKKYLNSRANRVTKLKMNGDLYMVPTDGFNAKRLSPSPCIRKDLVDKTGLQLPTTFDELYNVLKEVKKANPNTIGWTARRPSAPSGIKRELMIVAYPFGSGLGGWSRGIDIPYWEETANSGKGAWVYGPIRPEFKDVLTYFAKLYKEGLLDPDFANATADQWHEKNSNGKGVFSWDNFSFCTRWNQAVRGIDPKATWTPFPTIKGTKGARENDYTGIFDGGYCISANCKYPDRAIQLLDWKLSPIGIDVCSWGIQDTHYTLTGTRPAAVDDYDNAWIEKAIPTGSRVIKPDVFTKYKAKADPFRSYQSDTGTGQLDFGVLWDNALTYVWDAPGETDAWYAMSAADKGLHSEVGVPPFTADEQDKLKKIMTDVNAVIDPAIDKLVLGQATMADWDKAAADAIKVGAQDMEKIYNDAEARG